MKYWILTSEFPPYQTGGISTYAYHTSLMFAQEGHEVTVFTHDLSLSKDEITVKDGVRLVRFVPRKTGAHQFLGFFAYISYEYAFAVKEMMDKEGRPDIVESQEYHGIAYYLQQFKLLRYKNFADLPILITCHAPSFICLDYNHHPVYKFPEYWVGQMEKSCIRSADLLVTPSRYFVAEAKTRMNWEGIAEEYIVNPIAVQASEPASFQRNQIVCFGKLSPLKGTFELLSYFDALWKNGFKHPLQIIGGTQQLFHPEGATMKELVAAKYKHYLDNGLLILHNELTAERAKELLLDAHVILVPSLFDNLPYTVLEAMSWGKMVLASKQGGQNEIITHGFNGFLFDHREKDDFKKQLYAVLELGDEEAKSVCHNAIKTIAETYSYSSVYRQKHALMQRHLENAGPRQYFPFTEPQPVAAPCESVPGKAGLLSVVVPYYNMGCYIEDCIRSIVDSEFGPKEIIIVDDGSTEEQSIEKLKELESKYPVIVYTTTNQGLSNTRNFGASKASGEFLAFLDADDKVAPDYYTKAIEVLKSYKNVAFAGCWVSYFEKGAGTWPAFTPEPPYLLVHNMVNSSSLVYKRKAFLQGGLNDPQLVYGMEDWDSVISMVERGFNGVVLPEVLFHYRVRANSMARKFTKVKKLFLHKHIADKHKGLYQKYGVELANILNANGSGLDNDNPTIEARSNTFLPFSGMLQERIKEKIKQNSFLRGITYKIYKKVKS